MRVDEKKKNEGKKSKLVQRSQPSTRCRTNVARRPRRKVATIWLRFGLGRKAKQNAKYTGLWVKPILKG